MLTPRKMPFCRIFSLSEVVGSLMEVVRTRADWEDCCFVPSPAASAPSGVSVGPDPQPPGFPCKSSFSNPHLLFADAAPLCAGAGWKGSQGPGLSAGSRRCCSSSASALAPPGCRKNARHEAGRGGDPSEKCVFYFFSPLFRPWVM